MGKPLSVGIEAPDFTLFRDGGSQVSLKDFSGRKVVLYFYPKADTPGCTKEAISFNALRKDFVEADTAILRASDNSGKAQDKFRDKYSLALPLVTYEIHRVLEAYGVWGEKSMYGKPFMGV